jgi:hypothetical protein
MQPFPHRYTVAAAASEEGDVTLEGQRLPALRSAPPVNSVGRAIAGPRRPFSWRRSRTVSF